MAYPDLRAFIKKLEKENELKRIPFEVDPYLEITEFADRSVKSGGPALLFEKPKGSRIPVLINAFASERRMELALEVDSVKEHADRIVEMLEMRMPAGLINKLKLLPKLADMANFFPKMVSTGPCKEVIRTDGFSLREFPILTCWPGDGGRVHHAADGLHEGPRDRQAERRYVPHAGLRRAAPPVCTGTTQKAGAEHYAELREAGKQNGGRGCYRRRPGDHLLARLLPLPPDLDEMMIAGFLRREPVEMVKCETVTSKCPPTPRSCSKATSIPSRRAAKARSATTPATTRWRRLSGLPRHVHHASEGTRSTRRPSLVRPPMEDYYLGKATSASSCR